jgi:hypothetical protein
MNVLALNQGRYGTALRASVTARQASSSSAPPLVRTLFIAEKPYAPKYTLNVDPCQSLMRSCLLFLPFDLRTPIHKLGSKNRSSPRNFIRPDSCLEIRGRWAKADHTQEQIKALRWIDLRAPKTGSTGSLSDWVASAGGLPIKGNGG